MIGNFCSLYTCSDLLLTCIDSEGEGDKGDEEDVFTFVLSSSV